ncbi:MAG: D-alanyl-D-alanine carboxypeptidase, partial [Clostridia bacterium]|nr:D-alanyl-D-alanine carboxypeptidase [Clostridia bacterium]
NHLSCARDVAIMLSYAMKNEQYRQIAKTLTHVATEKSSTQKTTFYNKNKLLKSYGFCTGGKTGYTKIAGRCLATTAEKNGMKLSCVVLGRQDTYEQSVALYEKAYSEYYMKNLCSPKSFKAEAQIEKAKGKCVGGIKHSFDYPIKNSEENSIKTEITLDANICLPLKKGEKIGIMKIFLENQLLFSQNIYTIIDVEKKFDIKDPIKNWI